MKQFTMQFGIIPTLFKNMFKAKTLTPGLVVFVIATFILGTLAFLYQVVVPLSATDTTFN